MTETEKLHQAYRVCTDAENDEYDKVSLWSDYSDVRMQNEYTLKEQTDYASGTISNNEVIINSKLITADGMLDVYVPSSNCKLTPNSIIQIDESVTMTFPEGNDGTEIRVRCWKGTLE